MLNVATLASGSLSKEVSLMFLADLVVVLVAALLCGAAAARVGLPKMVGEITVGVLLGQTVLGRLCPSISLALFPGTGPGSDIMSALSQLAVVLLVGVAGMHVDVSRLRERMTGIAAISILGLALPLGGGIALGFAIPEPLRPADVSKGVFALFLGTALAVSAIPVIARILMDLGLAGHEIAQVILAAAVVDDVAGWLLLSFVTGLATKGHVDTVGVAAMSAVVVCIVAMIILLLRSTPRRYLTSSVSGWSASTTITATVTTILLFAAAGQVLGFEPVIGAFFAGMVVVSVIPADSAVHKPLQGVVIAFFSPIFFTTIGLQLDLAQLTSLPVLVLTAATCAVAVSTKFVGAGIGAKLAGFSWRHSAGIAAGLNTRGVIQIVIAVVGLRCGVFTEAVFVALVTVTIVTTVIAAPVLNYSLMCHLPCPTGTSDSSRITGAVTHQMATAASTDQLRRT